MPDIHIPQALYEQIEGAVPTAISPQDFVLQAVREKLSWESRKSEFYRLSDETRAAMLAKGMTEAELLADFEASRTISSGSDRG